MINKFLTFSLIVSLFIGSTVLPMDAGRKEVVFGKWHASYHNDSSFYQSATEYIKNTIQLVQNRYADNEEAMDHILFLEKQAMVIHQFPENAEHAAGQAKLFLAHLQQLPEIKSAEAKELIQSAEIACCSIFGVDFVKSIIFEQLHNLDQHFFYWMHQQKHPWYAFIHKPIHLWFTNQQEYVRKNIAYVSATQKTLFALLGTITIQLLQFQLLEVKSKQSIFDWYERFLKIATRLYGQKPSMESIDSFSELITTSQIMIDKGLSYHTKKQFLGAAQMPSHFGRNWVRYAAAGIGATIAGMWAMSHQADIPRWIANIKANAIWSVKNPYERFKELWWGNNENSINLLKDRYKTTVKSYRDMHRTLTVTDDEINRSAEKLDVEFLTNSLWKQYSDDWMAIAQRVSKDFSPASRSSRWVTRLNPAVWVSVIGKGVDHGMDIVDKIPHALPIVQLLADVHTHHFTKQNQMTFAMSAAVPLAAGIGISAVLSKKMYQNLTYTDYRPIRLTLVELAHLLNYYDQAEAQQMHTQDLGKMIFLIHKLKQLSEVVPVNRKDRFLADIAQLESATLDAHKKMKVIDLMYRTYEFLSPTFVR